MIRRIIALSTLSIAASQVTFAQQYSGAVAVDPTTPTVDPVITPPFPVVEQIVVPSNTTGRFLAISSRSYVGSGNAVCIVGFAVGSGGRHVLLRAIGPSLTKFGINDCLRKPKAEVFDKDSKLIATGIVWSAMDADNKDGIIKLCTSTGAFKIDNVTDDVLMHLKLSEGCYTLVISSADGAPGVVIGEVYESPTYRATGMTVSPSI